MNEEENIQVGILISPSELAECKKLARIEQNGTAIKAMMRLGMQLEKDRWEYESRRNRD